MELQREATVLVTCVLISKPLELRGAFLLLQSLFTPSAPDTILILMRTS